MRFMRGSGLCLLAALTMAAACSGPPVEQADAGGGFDQDRLESVEDQAESLANDLLALSESLRDRDLEAAAGYFEDPVETLAIPLSPAPPEPVVKWVQKHAWGEASPPSPPLPLAETTSRLEALLGHFSEMDDVRLKVKGAEFDDEGRAEANLKFYITGRDTNGRREWLRGTASARLHRPADRWKFLSLSVKTMESHVSIEDLFSEVSLPAGVAALFPPFGVPPNEGFVAHGAAAADVDLDGLIDIAATGIERNFLYLNNGDGTFRDVGEESLVALAPSGSGALFLDYDDDGDADLFLPTVGNQALLENRWIPDGKVLFHDVSERARVDVPAVGFSAATADVNGDGRSDIYVASYNR